MDYILNGKNHTSLLQLMDFMQPYMDMELADVDLQKFWDVIVIYI